jgi:tetratricopeptide (TPR) repeat protein
MMKEPNEHIPELYNTLERTPVDPASLSDSDKLTKYIVAKALLNGVQDEGGLKGLVSGIKGKSVYEYFSQSNSIFSDEFRKYVRFECWTEDLNQSLLAKEKGFGIQNTNKLSKYLPRDNYLSETKELITKGKNVLIQGPPDTGKTRLVYEVLKEEMEGYYLFSFWQDFWPNLDKLEFSDSVPAKNTKLIWFIDDLHYFHEDTQKMYGILRGQFDELIVIATLRSDKTLPENPLTDSMRKVSIRIWKKDEINDLANINSIPIKYELGNTPSCLVNDFGKLERIYESYKKKEKEHCLHTLHYIKLLREFLESVNCSLLESVFLYLRRKGSLNKDDFDRALIELENAGFITINEEHVFSKDIFFVKVVTGKKYPTMLGDMGKLVPLFFGLRKFSLLMNLGAYFSINNFFERAIYFYKQVAESGKNMKFLHYFYNNGGISLAELAELDSDSGKFEEAIEKYKKAIEIDPEDVIAHNNWGVDLVKLAQLDNDSGKFEEAIEKFEKAVEIDPEDATAYFNWGNSLAELAELDNDSGKFEEAIEKYKKAIEIDPKYAGSYLNWGNSLAELAELDNDSGKFEEAIEKYKKAIEIDPEDASAYNNWGVALAELAELDSDSGKFEEAIEKYKKAVEIDPKYAKAYSNWGISLEKLNDGKTKVKKISGLYTKAFLLFISEKEWKSANRIAVSKNLNKSEKTEGNPIYDIVFILNAGLTSILNPDEEISNEIKILKDFKKDAELGEDYTSSHSIILNAILENKTPDLKIDPESDDLVLSAAIVLANEIVSTSSQSA